MVIKKIQFIPAAIMALAVMAWASPAWATADFSAQTSLSCNFCHENPDGGGTLTPEGDAFRANGYILAEDGRSLFWPRAGRLLLGFIHVLAAFIWLGTIFYVHLFMGPRSLTGGLPKAEVLLGRLSILAVGLSGIGLVLFRLKSFDELWTTTFGLVLIVKVSLFLTMILVAILATVFIDRKLRKDGRVGEGNSGIPDGSDGGPAHVIVDAHLYDVSDSKLWKQGTHMGRHHAGRDLSEDLSGAPHGKEVMDRVKDLGPATETAGQTEPPILKLFVIIANVALICGALILLCVAYWKWGPPLVHAAEVRWRAEAVAACVACHRRETPGIYQDWVRSAHARNKVSCLHCHQAGDREKDISLSHLAEYGKQDSHLAKEFFPVPISAVVTPKDCSRCHPDEAKQYSISKHANTIEIIWEIDPWLNKGMNSDFERVSGCFACHGTVLKIEEGKLSSDTWPNTGVGRVNLDGSLGSCTSCHTRHRFTAAEARKAEACGQCHLGPDHPQIEIFKESKHGAIYDSFGHDWNFQAAPGTWTPGVDFRAPTCAACHMSGAGATLTTHDVTERLSWELQAPLTVRPQDFKPLPAKTEWSKERDKMKEVCLQCHGQAWVDDHYVKLDKVVSEYNEVYFKPAKAMLDDLYAKGLLDPTKFFDERLEVEYYELWHHEGRRARMGTAMMAPDYAWWHGFYECKKRFSNFMEEGRELLTHNKKAYVAKDFPNATGDTAKPKEIFGKK